MMTFHNLKNSDQTFYTTISVHGQWIAITVRELAAEQWINGPKKWKLPDVF